MMRPARPGLARNLVLAIRAHQGCINAAINCLMAVAIVQLGVMIVRTWLAARS